MYIFDNKITIENRAVLEEYLNGYEYETSGLSFSALYMWRDINEFCFEIIGDYMCISGISHLELDQKLNFMFPPLTKTGSYDRNKLRETILEAKKIFESEGAVFNLRLVPEHMTQLICDAVPEIEFSEDRPNFDYIYRREDLVELRGKKYHAKKNYINSFKKNYEYEYEPINSGMADELMEFIEFFNSRKEIPEHEMELLKNEEAAMRDVFENFEACGYYGGIIRIDGRIQALTAGGRLGSNMLTQHIEKANTDYRGLYPMICNEFCKALPEDIEFINREEDMGIENLRKAKLSYKPVKLLEKYIGNFKAK